MHDHSTVECVYILSGSLLKCRGCGERDMSGASGLLRQAEPATNGMEAEKDAPTRKTKSFMRLRDAA